MSKIHTLKTWPGPFEAVLDGRKRFEIRVNDRDFQVGDCLVLQEWDPRARTYSGRMESFRVTYLTQGAWGLPKEVCVLGIAPWAAPREDDK